MPRLDLRDLSLFRAIVEAGSITAGAARSNLALAAASVRVRGMEVVLGTKLLDRSRKGVAPTPAGLALLSHARTLLAGAERMHEEISVHAGRDVGHIRMLSNTNALDVFLPDALGRFLADQPGVTLDLQERLSDEIVTLVAAGEADLGIVAGTTDTGALETYPFRTDRFVVMTPLHHHLTHAPTLPFSAVIREDFVGLDRASALQRFLAGRASREGCRLRLRVQLRSFDAVCRMVAAGVGIGIVPETTARRAQSTMALAAIPLEDPWAVRELRICVVSDAALSACAKRLVRHLALHAA